MWQRVISRIGAHKIRLLAFVGVLLVVQSVAAYSQLSSTTEVSATDAVAEFRERQSAVSDAPVTAGDQQPLPALPPPRVTATAGVAAPAAPAPAVGPSSAPPPEQCDWACVTEFRPPEFGVYDYFQCGRTSGQCTGESDPPATERVGAIERDFPARGRRVVSAGNGASHWNNLHIYSEEHREEFDLSIDRSGVFNHRYLVELEIGGYTDITDIAQSPPFRVNQFPMTQGTTWSGKWDDANGYADGEYSGRIAAKEELTISGKRVRVWMIDTTIKLLGPRNRGDVHFVFWVDPATRLSVQEFYEQDITNERGVRYVARWRTTATSLQPQR